MLNKKLISYCALDISTGSINGVLARLNGLGEIVAVNFFRGNSAGIENGRMVNPGAFAGSLSAVIKKLEEASSSKIKSAFISFRYARFFCRHSTGIIPVCAGGNKVITSNEIRKVNEQAYTLGLSIDEEILHQIPQGYTVDGRDKVLRPEGLYGRRLELDLLMVTVSAADYRSVVSAVNRAGLKVESVALPGLAESAAILSKKDKEKGACLLDIDFDSTQVLIFKSGILRNLEILDFGWNSFTLALKDELKVPYELARDLAISYASASSRDIDSGQEVLIKKDQFYRPIKRKLICAIIEKQLQGMFDVVKEKLGSLRADILPGEIIVCGQTALLEGFLESCEKKLDIPTRLAKIENSPFKDIAYATAVGLIKYGLTSSWNFNPLKLPTYGNIFQKLALKSKEMYQEYF